MVVKIFNTLTRKREVFEPNTPGKVGMYVCGPTVYNYIHIGNARTFLSFDVMRRYLEWKGFEVEFVQNITDVDDKIINRANEEGVSPEEVSEKYTEAFQSQMERLGVKRPSVAPKATETIDEMIELIKDLERNGLAYKTPDGVYFSVRKFKEYGKLSRRDLEDMRAGERVDIDPNKEDPMDFALWKLAKPGEPKWPSPWGEGRPGWHIECSAMSLKYLGMSFDIHGGAQDLIFPHHENEVAQSEGATGRKPFVKYWAHGGLLNIDKEKMSKSLGNFTLLQAALKEWSANEIRMFMLGTHYRNPLDFTEKGLFEAKAKVERIETFIANLDFAISSESQRSAAISSEVNSINDRIKKRFIVAMDDDFNSAAALGVIFEHIREVNTLIIGGDEVPENDSLEATKEFLIDLLNNALGLSFMGPREDTKFAPDDKEIKDLLELREKARKEKDWNKADELRQKITDLGFELEDTPQGPRVKKIKS